MGAEEGISAKTRKNYIKIARFSGSFAELKSLYRNLTSLERRGEKASHVSDRVDRYPRGFKAVIHAFGVVPNVRRNISTKALDWQ